MKMSRLLVVALSKPRTMTWAIGGYRFVGSMDVIETLETMLAFSKARH